MKPPRLHEPDLIASALQATALMAALILPLALSIELKKTVIPVSLSVPIVTEVRPAALPPPDQGISELHEQLQQNRAQSKADLARRRQQNKERQQQEAERQRQEAERRQAEEKRQQEIEQEKRQRQRREQEAREKRKKLEQQQRQRDAAQKKRAAPRGLSAAQRASLIGRYTSGIKERVHRYMSNPEGIDAAEKIAVEVRVRLDSRGMLVATPVIERSSGHATYDNQAIRAIIRAADGGFELPDDPELRSEFGDLLLTIRPKK